MPSKQSNKAKRLIKREGKRKDKNKDKKDNRDKDNSSIIGDNSKDNNSKEGIFRNLQDLLYGLYKLKGN